MRFNSQAARTSLSLFILLLTVSAGALAQDGKAPWEEYDKLIDKRKAVTTLGPQLLGDQVDLATGALSFATTDVSIAGNSSLPVAVTRTFAVHGEKESSNNPFGDWDLDIPHISGLFAPTWHDNRCDVLVPPSKAVSGSGGLWDPKDVWYDGGMGADYVQGTSYWKGNNASMPGGGTMLRVVASSARPSTGGPYLWTTSSRTVFSCLPTIGNGTGQGFLAVTADGTKYWFDHMAQFEASQYEHTIRLNSLAGQPASYVTGTLPRKRNALYATRVEDRFGNSVTYTYANAYNEPLKVSAITANDGRSITFHYNTSNHIDRVTSGGRDWTYQYSANNFFLTGVVLPDGGTWSIGFSAFSAADVQYLSGDDPNWRSCFRLGPLDTQYSGPYTGVITHPSGAVGTFTVSPVVQARSNVPAICENYIAESTDPSVNDYNDTSNDYAIFPIKWHAFALSSKQITGPGLPTQTWLFSYTSAPSHFIPDGQTEPYKCDTVACAEPTCLSDACALTATTTIIGPAGEWTRHTFGNSYRYNEGKLLKVEEGVDENTILRTTVLTYDLAQAGRPYPVLIGASEHRYTDGFTSEYPRPEVSRVIEQQDVFFSRLVDTGCVTADAYCLDSFLRPIRQQRFSSLGPTNVDTTTYFDKLASWVLGQVATQSTNGIETTRVDHDATSALPIRTYAFGLLQNTLSYNADGTLATVKDGRNNVTSLSGWKRGIPQTIAYPGAPAVTEKAQVDDRGNVNWVEDELGTRTNYSYDEMDRLEAIVYPIGDTTAWNDTTTPFDPVTVAEYGIPAGHWKQTVQTGNGRAITYYDAQWRPVLAVSEDTGNAASKSFVVNRYDAAGRLVFSSYPVGSLTTVNDTLQGTTTEYDALGRVIRVKQDSELGVLTSTHEYLPGFQTRSTNPRGYQTTTSYQVFDSPATSRPVLIQAPQGVTTTITRDVFGKPLTVTRAGPGG